MDVSVSCGSVDPSVAWDVPVLDKFLYQFLHLESPFIQVVGWRPHICTWPRIRRWSVSGPASTVRQPLWLLACFRQTIHFHLPASTEPVAGLPSQAGRKSPAPTTHRNTLLSPAFSPTTSQLLHTLWRGIYPWIQDILISKKRNGPRSFKMRLGEGSTKFLA